MGGYSHYIDISPEQALAEIMHYLSHPKLLGDLIKPVVYGTHTVAYSLAAKVTQEIIQEETKSPKPARTGLRRLLPI